MTVSPARFLSNVLAVAYKETQVLRHDAAFITVVLAQPIMLLQISANVAGVVFVIASLHLLYLNTRLLPLALRPPLWRRVALVGIAAFYGSFVALSLSSFW